MKIKKNDVIIVSDTNFLLIKNIGSGGAGEVWLAMNDEVDYAVKFLRKDIDNFTEKKLRFEREADFCRTTNHENIIRVLYTGEFKQHFFYVMPFYPKTLRNIINMDNIDSNKKMNALIKLGEAIKYIHIENIIHRDIKPENILVNDEKIILSDFGIAHFDDSTLTKKGDLLANRKYASPEQNVKHNANNITSAADIYAYGCIINEIFTKKVPIGTAYKQVLLEEPIYYKLDSLIKEMINHEPTERPEIKQVLLELLKIREETNTLINDINDDISYKMKYQKIEKSIAEKILKTAIPDLFFGKYLWENATIDEIQKYNFNYHMGIGYSFSERFKNISIQEMILSICNHKQNYESVSYKNSLDKVYPRLDIGANNEHKALAEEMKKILNKYPVENRYDLTGKILQRFVSTTDYHCDEIIDEINREIPKHRDSLSDCPLIYLIYGMKRTLKENYSEIISDESLLFEENININFERTFPYEGVKDEKIFDEILEFKKKEIKKIIDLFKKKWQADVSIKNGDYIVSFDLKEQYILFEKYSLKKAKPHYVFEGDVLDILRIENEFDSIIILKKWSEFDITSTLAKIIGVRNDL